MRVRARAPVSFPSVSFPPCVSLFEIDAAALPSIPVFPRRQTGNAESRTIEPPEKDDTSGQGFLLFPFFGTERGGALNIYKLSKNWKAISFLYTYDTIRGERRM